MSNAIQILGPLPECVRFVAPMPGRFKIDRALRTIEAARLLAVTEQAICDTERRVFRKLRARFGSDLARLTDSGADERRAA
jgi:hypothetical protein